VTRVTVPSSASKITATRAVAGFDVTVEAVVRRVELAVVEPRAERRVALVEHLGERLVPAQVLARERAQKPS
jgi:hypothetical protein